MERRNAKNINLSRYSLRLMTNKAPSNRLPLMLPTETKKTPWEAR